MCGIFGFATNESVNNAAFMKKAAKRLLCLSESRGKEASGVAFFRNGAAGVFKRALPSHELIKEADYRAFMDANILDGSTFTALIGHSRLVTNGSSSNADNNQPVVKNGTITVHNGIIVNVDELQKANPDIRLLEQVDTEMFSALLEKRLQNEGIQRAASGCYGEIRGMASTLNLLVDYGVLLAATNNGSLYYCFSKNGRSVVFASERPTVVEFIRTNSGAGSRFEDCDIKQLAAGEGVSVELATMEHSLFCLSQPGDEQSAARGEHISVSVDKGVQTGDAHCGCAHVCSHDYHEFEIDSAAIGKLRRCTKCLLPETMPFIEFDDEGVCNYCRTYKKQQYLGEKALREKAETLRKKGDGADSIVSFSGGRDSSYGLHYFVKELGLHPVAFTYDWGMVTDIARRNQSRMCADLGVELILVSADIKRKRENIRKNVSAWLKKPDLGMVPLFMAGDKQYFYYANRVRQQYGLDTILMASNPFEATYFKSGFCGVRPKVFASGEDGSSIEKMGMSDVFKMGGHYLSQYITNPSYINGSLFDTVCAAMSYYAIPHDYLRLYDYIPWDEKTVDETLIGQYDWQTDPSYPSTWRIGDGTAPFYNYIYYCVAGFCENDTLRSNQIREGMLTREQGLKLVELENRPRFEAMEWYFDVIGVDMRQALKIVRDMPKLY